MPAAARRFSSMEETIDMQQYLGSSEIPKILPKICQTNLQIHPKFLKKQI
jgi:hypothetical protein